MAVALTLCRGCGGSFQSTTAFDDHRTGSHAADTRRCRTPAEMRRQGQTQDEAGRWSQKAPKRLHGSRRGS